MTVSLFVLFLIWQFPCSPRTLSILTLFAETVLIFAVSPITFTRDLDPNLATVFIISLPRNIISCAAASKKRTMTERNQLQMLGHFPFSDTFLSRKKKSVFYSPKAKNFTIKKGTYRKIYSKRI